MIRRKKLLKIGKKPQKQISREDRLFEEMVSNALKNNKKRASDKKYQAEKKILAAKKYYESFPYNTNIEPNSNWANGIGAKHSIFDPISLDKLDLEEINAKRKANNIDTPIEQAAAEAMVEAKRKAKQIAPLYNKGGYQFISEKEVKDIGKKTSEVD